MLDSQDIQIINLIGKVKEEHCRHYSYHDLDGRCYYYDEGQNKEQDGIQDKEINCPLYDEHLSCLCDAFIHKIFPFH